jgi:hypothetical protein
MRQLLRASVLCVLLLACSDARTASSLRVDVVDGGTAVSASWQYASSSVDVNVALVSTRTTECTTFTRLWIDKAASGADTYRKELSCTELELTAQGDLVLLGEPTEHDWSIEPLEVDTASERVHLGPWQARQGEPSYRFTLHSRPCGNCECPELYRSKDGERIALALGRFCD